jgi:hypothetical protein
MMGLARWQAFYKVGMRVMNYVDNAGLAVAHAPEQTVPCFGCDLLCPFDVNITIDHQRPQAGNESDPSVRSFGQWA